MDLEWRVRCRADEGGNDLDYPTYFLSGNGRGLSVEEIVAQSGKLLPLVASIGDYFWNQDIRVVAGLCLDAGIGAHVILAMNCHLKDPERSANLVPFEYRGETLSGMTGSEKQYVPTYAPFGTMGRYLTGGKRTLVVTWQVKSDEQERALVRAVRESGGSVVGFVAVFDGRNHPSDGRIRSLFPNERREY